MSHTNNGKCAKCAEIMDEFCGLHPVVRDFIEKCQAKYPEFHVSDACRGYLEQELYFKRGASLAHYGESSHNYGCGADTFFLIDGAYSLSIEDYEKKIKPMIPDTIAWGHEWPHFRETPHFELKAWKTLRDQGLAKLVEQKPEKAVA